MIKAAFFDIDWTLYDHAAQRYVPSGIEAVKKLKENGARVFICSARPFNSMDLVGIFNLGIPWDGYIASAGAVAVVDGVTVRKLLMEKKDVTAIINKMNELGRTLEFVTPTERFLTAPADQYVESYHWVYQYQQPEVRTYTNEECIGMLLFIPEELDEEVRSVCPSLAWYRFHESGVDISGVPHEKGEAIQNVLDYLGTKKEESISFGDDFQDISMANATGIFVAMGNGKEEVKQVADYVTDRIEEDGLEKALKHFKLI